MEKFQKHFRKGAKSLAVIMLILYSSPALSQLADTPWPMFMHDAQHTGRSPYVGPANTNLGWVLYGLYWVSYSVHSEPIIGPDNTIYFSGHHDFRAANPDGTIKWIHNLGTSSLYVKSESAAISKDGTIYFVTSAGYGGDLVEAGFCALNPDGTLKWKYKGIKSGSSPTISSDGTIYLCSYPAFTGEGDYSLCAFTSDGNLIWSRKIGYVSTPTISPDGNLIVTSGRDTVYAFDVGGDLKWKFYRIGSNNVIPPVIARDGTIYVASSNGTLKAFNTDGTYKWGFYTGGYINEAPCVSKDGTVYVSARKNWSWDPAQGIYALNADGTLKWKKTGLFESKLCVDAEGVLYVGSIDTVYAILHDGTTKWTYIDDGMGTIHSVIISAENEAYVNGGGLQALYQIAQGRSPDLTITADAISFDPPTNTVSANGDVKVTAIVREQTGTQSATCNVIFYYDDKFHPIDTVRAYVQAGKIGRAKINWNTEGINEGNHQIIVEILNSNPAESDLSNNQVISDYAFLPFIQNRINMAQNGDTVWVAPGTYYENIKLKNGVVIKSRMGAEQTIIDGMRKGSVVTADSVEVPATLDGFTITNGKTWSDGGGVNIGRDYFGQTAAIVINNIITNNEAWAGGGIHIYRSPNSIIKNNLIYNNKANLGAGIYNGQSWCEIHNNTIVNNQGTGIEARGYGGMEPDIRNCIFWENQTDLSMIAYADYSVVQNAPASLIGSNCISSDPIFTDPDTFDYSLQENSPCIDTGDPASPRDPDGTRADMGWKYYDQSSTIARIVGNLKDAETGAPVKLAKIYLRGPKEDLLPPDDQGHYVFAVPADTGYIVEVFAPNHKSVRTGHITTVIGTATEVNFSLEPYPTEITLFPPTELQGSYQENKVHLTWQRPQDELAFDDGFYEQAVGFLNSQGVLAAGPFEPSVYPARIEKVKVAFDGERAGDRIDLFIYLDASGTATQPSSSLLVSTIENLSIEVGGGFQEINVNGEGITLNSGNFFIGIKQVNTDPMYLLLDNTAQDGHGFYDANLDGTFQSLTNENIHGALAIRTIVSMPSSGGELAILKTPANDLPFKQSNFDTPPTILEKNNKQDTGLITKLIVDNKNETIAVLEKKALTFLAKPPQSIRVYRSETSPVEISETNKIATMTGSATSYDDMNLSSAPIYYYIVAAKYSTGEIVTSNEINIDVTSVNEGVSKQLPQHYELAQNYPNPFNPETTIHYQLPKQSQVELEIYNILGEMIKTVVNEKQQAGYYSIHWDGKDKQNNPVSSGVYLYTLKAGEFERVRKMVLMR